MDVTLAELERLKKHRNGALSPNTLRSYMTGIRQWQAWAHQEHKPWFPAKPEHLALWLSDLGVSGVKATTMKQRLKGVGYLHREQEGGGPNAVPVDEGGCCLLGRSTRHHRRRQYRSPLKPFRNSWTELLGGTHHCCWSCVGRCFAPARPQTCAGETWTRSGACSASAAPRQTRRARVPGSNLPDQCWHALDDLWSYRRGWARLPESRVFLLSATSVSRRIRLLGTLAGMEGVSGHSLRRGMAVDLVHRGESIPEIMAAGRWKSPEMVARYTEEAATSGALARYAEEEQYEF